MISMSTSARPRSVSVFAPMKRANRFTSMLIHVRLSGTHRSELGRRSLRGRYQSFYFWMLHSMQVLRKWTEDRPRARAEPWKHLRWVPSQTYGMELSILHWLNLMADCPATEQSIARDGVFVSPRVCVRVDSEIELLAQVLASPVLGPHVPHPHIIQRHVHCSPRLRIDLHKQDHSRKLHGLMDTKRGNSE